MRKLPVVTILLSYLFIISGLAIHSPIFAQNRSLPEEKEKPPFKERLFFGGSLGLQFGNLTLIDVSPMIGYKITPRIGIGVSPTYKYYSYRNFYGQAGDLKTNVFGGGIFGRFIIVENIFAHAEYELLSYKTKDPGTPGPYNPREFQSVLVGAGYRERVADNAFMYLLLLWNLNETIDSPYNNPIIRAGFSIGF